MRNIFISIGTLRISAMVEKNTLKVRSGETYFDIYIPREELSGKITTIKDVAIDQFLKVKYPDFGVRSVNCV